MKKTIKTFKELSSLNRRDLFERNPKTGEVALKKKLDGEFVVSVARQLATGFDTKRKPNKQKIKEAREIITEYYEAASAGKTKVFRPRKENRKAYAEVADINPRFKVFPMPILTDSDKFKMVSEKIGKKKIKKAKLIGQFVDREGFNFTNLKQMSIKPYEETEKLLKRIDRKIGKKTKRALKFKVGKYETKAIYSKDNVAEELEKWKQIYGAKKIKSFVVGLQVFTFRNQNGEENIPSKSKQLQKKKPKAVKRAKIRMK